MNINDEAKIKRIADTYGFEKQREVLVEECSELIQAVQKLKRAEDTDDAQHIEVATMQYIEELADVTVMIGQMSILLTSNLRGEYQKKITQKLDRQIARIEQERQKCIDDYKKWRNGVTA